MEFTAYSVLYDIGFASLLLLVATLLRAKIKLFQRFFLPSSLIAGLLGLALAQQGLGWISFSSQAGSYAYILVILVFGAMKMGHTEKKSSVKAAVRRRMDTAMLTTAAGTFQFGIALVVGGTLLTLCGMALQEGQLFASLMPAGFFGGHGSGISIGDSYAKVGLLEHGVNIGTTFSTIGILLAVIVGVIVINIGVRKKWTRFIPCMDFNKLPVSMRTGMIPEEEQGSAGKETTNPMSIDTLGWHMALVVFVGAMAEMSCSWLTAVLPDSYSIPTFCVSLFYGLLLQKVLDFKWVGVGKNVDTKVMNRISGGLTDFMVTFGVATLEISVVVEFAVPILIISVLGVCSTLFYMLVISKKLYNSYWFERSIFVLGWSFGVLAMGVTLLRIVDPEYKSNTLDDYGSVYPFCGIIDTLLFIFVPALTIADMGLPIGLGLLAISFLCWFICYKTYGIQKCHGDVPRPVEAEIAALYK